MYYEVSLPPVKQHGKKLRFVCEFQTDNSSNLTYLHIWREGFLGHAEDVELVALSDNEFRVVRCRIKSRAFLEAVVRFTSESREETYTVALLNWANKIAKVIDDLYGRDYE